ncbi:Na(+)/H(+) antiporter subunit D [Natrarchaeobaculum sulfurireducens]|uniref:NADH:ubiquinone oxidoreductase subunit 4 (Chain M) n=1 Tax=Natrarchaeobaculum sulfurireducens TaxID=2044521 RepID=A0A346PGU8_9EURY|nr:Na(+)/H(+) antiporter subunit D [Natrarchaeobaculum sulfurireducens]AXR78743.1 NADH:ubiquinone oxidoreductase subunit 4 (chain M) [Natrarchaeobaculum sulfurireducens]AXR81207.1 PH adaptation potassium efflux system protein D2 [Natrarchaeobaculum sulfurireducens]
MNELLSVPPALLVAVALVLTLVLPRRAAHGVATLSLIGVVVWALLVPEGTGPTATFMGFELLVLEVDGFSRLMAIIFGGFGAFAVAYAYFADTDTRHLLWGLGYVTASLWTVMVGDWLSLVVGWEAMAIASTVFVWQSGGRSIRTGYRYALAHGIGGSLLLAGVALYLFYGTDGGATALHFAETNVAGLEVDLGTVTFSVTALLMGAGIGLNAAIIGLHAWLPDTYPSPNVATSVFLACYTTKTAVYASFRAFPEGNIYFAYMGGAMAIYGAAFALAQKDMRRLLSYHIQGQVGFMLAGIGIGSTLGVAGGFAHLFNHILYKGLLFMAAGIIILKLGKESLDKFGAIGTTAPIALGAFLVGALSISGVPGFNGFVSKGMLIDAVVEANLTTLEWMLYLGSVGTFASFIKFGYYAFLDGEPIEMPDADWGHAVVTGGVAAGCIGFGLYYPALYALVPGSEAWGSDPYTLYEFTKVALLASGGLLVFVVAKPLLGTFHGGIDVDRAHDPLAFYGAKGASGGLGGGYNRVNDAVVATGWALVRTAHDPSRTIRTVIPSSLHERYDQRLEQTPGKTGGKLGIGLTIYVAAGVLMLALGFSLFIQ